MSDPVEQVEVEEEQETSLREDMEAAMSEVEEANDETPEVAHVEETPEVEEKETQSIENGDTTPTATTPPGAEETTAGVKAPQSWSPKLREDFSKLPDNIKAQISKRENEINKFQNDGAESRKFGDKIQQTLQPYQAVMSAQGFKDPVQAVKGLMDTAATLQMGSDDQKAQRLAELVQHYGIDIQKLDNALSGQPQTNTEQSQLEKMLEQKLAPMQQFMSSVQNNQQQSQQKVQQNAQNSIAEFEQKAEFIKDVRLDMADLMDMAVKRGQQMSLQEAYDKACAINPEISSILNQRSTLNTTQDKRYAASSIRGNQVGIGGKPEANSIEDALNQAWDDQMR